MLRGGEVRQDDLCVCLMHDVEEVCSILAQKEKVLLRRHIQLSAHHDTRYPGNHCRLPAQEQLHQDAGGLLQGSKSVDYFACLFKTNNNLAVFLN